MRRGEGAVPTLLVANPKGGTAKTTLATNAAGWLAGRRRRVVLADLDPQQSSSQWLARRPPLFPTIGGWSPAAKKKGLKELDPEWVVVDTPAALHGEDLRDAVRRADVMLVPLAPSAFDIAATQSFLDVVAEQKAVRRGELAIGLVAMRVDARTRSATELDEFLAGYGLPLVTHLRDTQVYVACARDGASVFDLPRSRGEHDWAQWQPLTRWIARAAAESAA
jgi:chromosome partitioning protein